MGQIYALLFLSDRPLNADEIVTRLGFSRSNVSMGLKELETWRLVKLQHLPGDRRHERIGLLDHRAQFLTAHADRLRDAQGRGACDGLDGDHLQPLHALSPGAYDAGLRPHPRLPAGGPLRLALAARRCLARGGALAQDRRGAAFEFRAKAPARQKPAWDVAFQGGSILAAFSQGWMLGSYILGFAPGWGAFAFAMLTGVFTVAGYALIGACWLVWRGEGDLQNLAAKWARQALYATWVGVLVVSAATPFASPRIFGGKARELKYY